jgi:chorismate mutase
MSPSSRESNLSQLREAIAHCNSELFLTLKERRALCVKVQEYKADEGRYSRFDPEREKLVFQLFKEQLANLTVKELLAFSLIMEDQAMAMAPGSYPSWSQSVHIHQPKKDLVEMINPLMLKLSHPELFSKISLSAEFKFLQDF